MNSPPRPFFRTLYQPYDPPGYLPESGPSYRPDHYLQVNFSSLTPSPVPSPQIDYGQNQEGVEFVHTTRNQEPIETSPSIEPSEGQASYPAPGLGEHQSHEYEHSNYDNTNIHTLPIPQAESNLRTSLSAPPRTRIYPYERFLYDQFLQSNQNTGNQAGIQNPTSSVLQVSDIQPEDPASSSMQIIPSTQDVQSSAQMCGCSSQRYSAIPQNARAPTRVSGWTSQQTIPPFQNHSLPSQVVKSFSQQQSPQTQTPHSPSHVFDSSSQDNYPPRLPPTPALGSHQDYPPGPDNPNILHDPTSAHIPSIPIPGFPSYSHNLSLYRFPLDTDLRQFPRSDNPILSRTPTQIPNPTRNPTPPLISTPPRDTVPPRVPSSSIPDSLRLPPLQTGNIIEPPGKTPPVTVQPAYPADLTSNPSRQWVNQNFGPFEPAKFTYRRPPPLIPRVKTPAQQMLLNILSSSQQAQPSGNPGGPVEPAERDAFPFSSPQQPTRSMNSEQQSISGESNVPQQPIQVDSNVTSISISRTFDSSLTRPTLRRHTSPPDTRSREALVPTRRSASPNRPSLPPRPTPTPIIDFLFGQNDTSTGPWIPTSQRVPETGSRSMIDTSASAGPFHSVDSARPPTDAPAAPAVAPPAVSPTPLSTPPVTESRTSRTHYTTDPLESVTDEAVPQGDSTNVPRHFATPPQPIQNVSIPQAPPQPVLIGVNQGQSDPAAALSSIGPPAGTWISFSQNRPQNSYWNRPVPSMHQSMALSAITPRGEGPPSPGSQPIQTPGPSGQASGSSSQILEQVVQSGVFGPQIIPHNRHGPTADLQRHFNLRLQGGIGVDTFLVCAKCGGRRDDNARGISEIIPLFCDQFCRRPTMSIRRRLGE